MKKTKHTMLTAAMLAASVGTASANAMTASAIDDSTADILPQPAYGPPTIIGDLNYDMRVDVFDFNMLLTAIQSGDEDQFVDYYVSDVNRDDRIDISDAVTMKKFLLGKINYFQQEIATKYGPPIYYTSTEPVTTTIEEPQDKYGPPIYYTSTEPVTTTKIEELQGKYGPPSYYTTTTQTKYGPPPAWAETETTTTVDVTETEIIQTTYGPPMWLGTETTVSVTETMMTQPAYGVVPYLRTETHTTTINPEKE